MDTLGALALATEPPTDDILLRMPYEKDAAIVTEIMWRNIFGHAIYQVFALMFIVFAAPGWLCADYWTRCYTFQDEQQLICTEWNPYYTTSLYEDEESINFWTSKNLKPEDYNQDALLKMRCDKYA